MRPSWTTPMRIALLTDIHGNREALTACLNHAGCGRIDRFVFLGDYVGYGADPVFVIETVMEHVARGAVALLGNHDAAVIEPRSEHDGRGGNRPRLDARPGRGDPA